MGPNEIITIELANGGVAQFKASTYNGVTVSQPFPGIAERYDCVVNVDGNSPIYLLRAVHLPEAEAMKALVESMMEPEPAP